MQFNHPIVKKSIKQYIGLIALFLITLCTSSYVSAVSLPSLISDNMVMQQNKPVHIWGKGEVGEKVTVKMLGQKQYAITNNMGKWEIWLHPMTSSGPVSMTISGKNTIEVKNILLGEVWFACGQSNMEWSVRKSNNSEAEIADANYPEIRFFDAQRSFRDSVQEDIVGKWVVCTPASVPEMTGSGYFFTRGLHKHLKQPVGLIDASWGATRIEAWTPKEVHKSNPKIQYWTDKWTEYQQNFPDTYAKYPTKHAEWEVKAAEAEANGEEIPKEPREPKRKNKNEPSSIYNGVVAPISLYTIRGIIWYQGENNAYKDEAFMYRYIFPDMIKAWRRVWNQGDFPFIYAQLSILWDHPYWPVLRESQTEALKLKNTAMIMTYDVGDSTDAHFKNKQAVGKRFELAARKLVYGEDLVASGPMFRQMTIEGDSLRIWFDEAAGLKPKEGTELLGFEMAAEDGKLFPATASIDNETVVLYSPLVKHPTIARYAFKHVTLGNLVNEADLPAVPFRTDVKDGL